MNKKIEEMIQKCTTMCMGVRQFDERQFAELIIQECLSAIERTPRHLAYTSYDYGLMNGTIRAVKESVKDNFNL